MSRSLTPTSCSGKDPPSCWFPPYSEWQGPQGFEISLLLCRVYTSRTPECSQELRWGNTSTLTGREEKQTDFPSTGSIPK